MYHTSSSARSPQHGVRGGLRDVTDALRQCPPHHGAPGGQGSMIRCIMCWIAATAYAGIRGALFGQSHRHGAAAHAGRGAGLRTGGEVLAASRAEGQGQSQGSFPHSTPQRRAHTEDGLCLCAGAGMGDNSDLRAGRGRLPVTTPRVSPGNSHARDEDIRRPTWRGPTFSASGGLRAGQGCSSWGANGICPMARRRGKDIPPCQRSPVAHGAREGPRRARWPR